MAPLAHLFVEAGVIRDVVITVGDPGRAAKLAALCESSKELAYNREYRTFDCFHKGKAFTICSHGVGSSGAAICFEELIKGGAKVICRAGTCGSLLPEQWKQGDIIVVSAAVRDEGTSERLIPLPFPAVSDPEQFLALQAAAKENGARHVSGIVVSSDVFYPGVSSTNLEMWSKANVVGVEMECSALFVIASLRKVKACSLCTIDGSPLKWDEGDYGAHSTLVADGKKRMLDIVIAWAVKCSTDTNSIEKGKGSS